MICHYGDHLHIRIWGASHDPQIGVDITGIAANLPVDLDALQHFLDRRAPGKNAWTTNRKESDIPHFLGGIYDGHTTGETISAVINNTNHNSKDYDNIRHIPRPGHADFTAWHKYGPEFDMSGGGPFSGRMTAPLCIAGGLCKQWLQQMGIAIGAHIFSVCTVSDEPFDPIAPNLKAVQTDFPVLDSTIGEQMQQAIATARQNGDSLGGVIECAVLGLPIGIGGPLFDGLEGKIAHAIYGIPGVKGLEFGLGFASTKLHGSQTNDSFIMEDGRIRTATNHSGGILGGISNGMPLMLRVAIKPTPSIAIPQQSVNMDQGEEVTLQIQGRHDPCIVPRAVPVVESAVAIAIYDMILNNQPNK